MPQENDPLVTALVPVYNHESYVMESIRSLIDQTYRKIELIVINDGSTDRSHEKVLAMAEECRRRFVRFEYINRENIGLSATMNQALAMATGKYLSTLASDDVALPQKIELLANALEPRDSTYAAAFGNARFIDDQSQPICLDDEARGWDNKSNAAYETFLDFYTRDRSLDYRGEEFGSYASLLVGNYLPAMSNLTRTAALREAGGWTRGNVIEDWEMWLKLSRKYKFALVDIPVALYRWHSRNAQKTARDGLGFASFALIDREKEFCRQHNMFHVWKESHDTALTTLFFNRRLPSSRRLAIVKPSDIGVIAQAGIKLTMKKLTTLFST